MINPISPLFVGSIATLLAVLLACTPEPELLPAPRQFAFTEKTVELRHTVQFEPGRSSLSRTEHRRLEHFLSTADPMTEGMLGLALAPKETAKAEALADALKGAGRDRIQLFDAIPKRDQAVVVIRHRIIVSTHCSAGDAWEHALLPPGDTLPLGCSGDLNLQAMIEEPRDLVRGRDLGPAPAKPAIDLARRHLSRHGVDPAAPIEEALPSSETTPRLTPTRGLAPLAD